MTRPPADRNLVAALAALSAALTDLAVPAMVIGGLAVIARGVARLTRDIDATVSGETIRLSDLFAGLAARGIVPRIERAEEFARRRQVLLLEHSATGTPLEVSLAWLPFELEALDRATSLAIQGVEIPVALPEDLIVYKAVAWRGKDQDDIEQLVLLYGDEIDLGRIRRLVQEFAEALDAPERVQELEELLRRCLE